jgi:hypothetical protein
MVTDGSSAVATQTYTLTISAATALTRAGVLAQIAAGGGWTTGITLTNNFTSPVMVNAVFRGSDGSLLNIPLTTVLQGVKQSGTSSTFTGTINPNATLAISLEDRLASTVVGWADILSSGPVGGFAIFRYTDTTGKVSEGTSPLQTQFPSKFVVTYENTSGFATGMAIANPSSNPATLSVTISDQDGVQLSTSSLVLAGNSHSTFFLGDKFSVTTGKLGIVTFQSSGSEGAAALGLRFSPFGTFTSVPTIPVP